MNAIYALYDGPDSAQKAVDSLESASNVRSRDITVITSEPFEEYRFGHRDHRTLMPWLAALGAMAGGLCGFCLAVFSQNAYPVRTGAMPLAPFATNAIVTYEMTMLGAILTTTVTLLITAGLPAWRSSQLYDPGVSDGKILVGVVNPPVDSQQDLERRLLEAGADRVIASS